MEARSTGWKSEDAIKVPASAVFRQGDGWAVYRVDGKVARLQAVTIGERTARDVQIVDGIDEGAEVVLHPSDRIRDGVEVVAR